LNLFLKETPVTVEVPSWSTAGIQPSSYGTGSTGLLRKFQLLEVGLVGLSGFGVTTSNTGLPSKKTFSEQGATREEASHRAI